MVDKKKGIADPEVVYDFIDSVVTELYAIIDNKTEEEKERDLENDPYNDAFTEEDEIKAFNALRM